MDSYVIFYIDAAGSLRQLDIGMDYDGKAARDWLAKNPWPAMLVRIDPVGLYTIEDHT